MRRRLKQAALVVVVLVVAAQFIRPSRVNPPIDHARTIEAHLAPQDPAAPVLNRSCGDCHSNRTEWRWYSQVAPLSWVMARAVSDGRKVINFSEWGSYPRSAQATLLDASCASATAGKMPGPYTWFRPETALSPKDIEAICAAARSVHDEVSLR
jgi:hypothetical protein